MPEYTPDKIMLQCTCRDWMELFREYQAKPEFMKGFREWEKQRNQVKEGSA